MKKINKLYTSLVVAPATTLDAIIPIANAVKHTAISIDIASLALMDSSLKLLGDDKQSQLAKIKELSDISEQLYSTDAVMKQSSKK